MNNRWIRFILEEAKFVKSIDDLKNAYWKLPYLLPRITSNHYRDSKIPLSLQIEPTNFCNVSCICCSRNKMDRKIGYMDFGLFQKIVDDAAENGVKRIHLYLHGEPLLHPQLIDMIRHVKSSGIGVTIATNGMPLDARKIETLMHTRMNNADHIIFSVLGYSKEVHEKVMKGVNHEKVLKNIQDILQWREILNMNGPIIETVMYIMPENKNEEAQFNKYWRGIVDHVRRVGNISEQFAKHKKEDNSIPSRNKTCKNLWERMTIFWNGDVTICCADLDGNYVLGNLKEKSIRDIWNSNQLLLIRKFHKEKNFKKIPFCLKCDWP